MRGATYNVNYEGSDGKFLSTLPVRGATHHCEDHKAVVLLISIHAPREGSDVMSCRSPSVAPAFLSTLPVRGATTLRSSTSTTAPKFLSTLPVRGATCRPAHRHRVAEISIHAPREGSDHTGPARAFGSGKFLSTLPVRGATQLGVQAAFGGHISIHAPREGSDRGWTRQARLGMISIHAPREGSDGDQRARPPRRRHFYPRSP